MQEEIQALEVKYQLEPTLENAKNLVFAYFDLMGDTEKALDFLSKMHKAVWKAIVNEYFKESGILYGFLFLNPKMIEEANLLLQISDIDSWREEFRENGVEVDFNVLEQPERDTTAVDLEYNFTKDIYATVMVLSGGTNYWLSAQLLRKWTKPTPQPAYGPSKVVAELEPSGGEELNGDFIFEYKKKTYHLRIMADPTLSNR